MRAPNCARIIAELRAHREVLRILLRRLQTLRAVGELLIAQPQRRRNKCVVLVDYDAAAASPTSLNRNSDW